ncbi:MAG: RRXRR domain-containing protein, partial [Gammaproteobacteria bacterium]
INRSKPFDKRAHREKRFNNRRQNKLPPSIRANRELEYRVVSELRKLFPITTVIYEYVKARTTPGCGFSPVMVGQQQAIEWLSSDGRVETLLGWETSRLRKYLGLAKSRDKAVQMPESHAHDAIALAASHFVRFDRQVDTRSHGHVWKGSVEVTPAPFSVIQRPQLYRRQLHFENPARGGERKRKGGTVHHRDRNAGHNIRVECFPDSNKHAYPTGGVLNECGAGVDRRPAPCARRRLATKHCI